ncbi:hypothetical protein JYT20_01185 [Rhodothermus sp. AH-315-K08]|nr:hypothetical protein [Rhodothermus sp. AH-315-K08]
MRDVVVHGEFVYVAGDFLSAGGAPSQSIARWDRSTGDWMSMDGGVNGSVWSVAVADDGTVYAGGDFSEAGKAQAKNIARWDGLTWSPLGDGIDGTVGSLAIRGDQLFAAGAFLTASGLQVNRIARWDGSQWNALADGVNDPGISALAIGDDGVLYAGGLFSQAGAVSVSNIAQWNGQEWSGLGSGTDGAVRALAVDGGLLYAGGRFLNAGGNAAPLAARWDGNGWQGMGDDFGQGIGGISAIAVNEQGNVYIGGELQRTYPANAAVWDGTAWTPLDNPFIFEILAIAVSDGDIYLGGLSPIIPEGGNLVNQLFRYDGDRWGALGGPETNGMTDHVYALVRDDSSDEFQAVYAAGSFDFAGISPANGVARWDGATWTPLDSGLSGRDGFSAEALALAPDGTVYVGGTFDHAGPVEARNIAAWRGDTWEALGGGLDGRVEALVLKGDTLYAGGWFEKAYGDTDSVQVGFVALWDGVQWSSVGEGVDGPVSAIALSEQNDLLVGGYFTQAGGREAHRIARWDGAVWSSLGTGMDYPVYVIVTQGETVYAGGNFLMAGGAPAAHIARWEGQAWERLEDGLNGDVRDLAIGTRGDLYVAGAFSTAGGLHAANVARWDGAEWDLS